MARGQILMGVIGRPHGVRGLVHVQSYTADPASLARYAPLRDSRGRTWSLTWRGEGVAELRDADGVPLRSRNDAERLVNTQLFVDRAQLPDAGEDEFYLADLIGLRAETDRGATLGRIAAVHDYGAGSSLEIARDGGGILIVPFTRASVPEIAVEAGRAVVVPPPEIEARA